MRYAVTEALHTFLFTDLVGFTALAAERGDHHAADVAVSFYERVRPVVPDHRAEEVKTIGDALMLRGDDPALAVCLGLRIVHDLGSLDGFPPVRVGMHTGPAVERAGDWYGTTVNIAARLCAAAGGGEVLISEATREAAGRMAAVAVDERRLHWLKNVTEPVAARVVHYRPRAGKRRCPAQRRGATPLMRRLRRVQAEVAPS
jgi:adenylate cyclase